MAKTKCEVCGNEFEGAVCTQCGWQLVILPASAPEALKQQLSQSTRIMKNSWQEKQTVLESAVKRMEEMKASYEKTIADLTAQLRSAQSAKPLAGMVLVTNLNSKKVSVAPIYSGEVNSYGSDSSVGSHHKIVLDPFEAKLAPKHFSVEVRGEHLLLRDLTDGTLGIDSRGAYMEGRSFRHGNDTEIRILKIQ